MSNWKLPEKVSEEIVDFLANFSFNFGIMALTFVIGVFFLEQFLVLLLAYFLRQYIKNH
jgi:hypothetical protein